MGLMRMKIEVSGKRLCRSLMLGILLMLHAGVLQCRRHRRHEGTEPAQRHVGEHNNKEILRNSIGEAMANNRMNDEGAERLVHLGHKAAAGDEAAMNTLEKDGVINHNERRALAAGAAGEDVRHDDAIEEETGMLVRDRNRRPQHRKQARKRGERLVDVERKLEIQAAHGSKKAQRDLARMRNSLSDPAALEDSDKMRRLLNDGRHRGRGRMPAMNTNAPNSPASRETGAALGAKHGEEAGARAGAEAGARNGLGAATGAKIGAEAGRRAGEAAGRNAGSKGTVDYSGAPNYDQAMTDGEAAGVAAARRMVAPGKPNEPLSDALDWQTDARNALERDAEEETANNLRLRNARDRILADKARAREAENEIREANLVNHLANGYRLSDEQLGEVKDFNDANGLLLLQEKAEGYLAEDRTKTKAMLYARAQAGDKPSKDMLEDLLRREKLAAETVKGDPKAAEEFAQEYVEETGRQREMKPLSEIDDEETLAAVAAQAASTTHKINYENELKENSIANRDARQKKAEERAAKRIDDEGATGDRADEILREEQVIVDEEEIDRFGQVSMEQALAKGVPIDEAQQAGDRAKEAARAKMNAVRDGRPLPEAEEFASSVAATKPNSRPSEPKDHLLSQAAQRDEAFMLAKKDALRHGAPPGVAEAAGQTAYNDTLAAQEHENDAIRKAMKAEEERDAAIDAANKASEAADRAEQVKRDATDEVIENAQRAELPRSLGRAHDEVDQIGLQQLAEKMNKKAKPRKQSVADYAREQEEKEREEELAEERKQEAIDEAKRREEFRRRSQNPSHPETMTPENAAVKAHHDLAKGLEEQMALANEDAEAAKAGYLAKQNVRAMNGSEAEAQVEGDRAAALKKQQLANEREARKRAHLRQLSDQLPPGKAEAEADHLALSHTGNTPVGHTLAEIQQSQNDALKKKREAEEAEQEIDNAVSGAVAIPDTQSTIPLNNAKVTLPLIGMENVPAQNEEEAEVKEKQKQMRDAVRNKVTKTQQNTGLNVIKTDDGYLNVPESAKKLKVKKGTVYMTKPGYDSMKAQGKDVEAFHPKIADEKKSPLPGNSVYYEADITDMDMEINPNAPENKLSNGNETIDAQNASMMVIKEGELETTPWKDFSSVVRPAVYQSMQTEEDDVTEELRQKFKEQELQNKLDQKSSVETFTSPDGTPIVEVTPAYGVKSHKDPSAVVAKPKTPDTTDEEPVDLAQESDDYDIIYSFISESGEYELDPTPQSNPNYRPDNGLENKVYNTLVYNAPTVAKQLGLPDDKFLKRLESLPEDFWTSIIEFYTALAGSPDAAQLMSKIDAQPFFNTLKNTFPETEPSTVYHSFAPAIKAVTRLPDMANDKIVSITPKTPVQLTTDANRPSYKQVVQKVPITSTTPDGTRYIPSSAQIDPTQSFIPQRTILDHAQHVDPRQPAPGYFDPFNPRENNTPLVQPSTANSLNTPGAPNSPQGQQNTPGTPLGQNPNPYTTPLKLDGTTPPLGIGNLPNQPYPGHSLINPPPGDQNPYDTRPKINDLKSHMDPQGSPAPNQPGLAPPFNPDVLINQPPKDYNPAPTYHYKPHFNEHTSVVHVPHHAGPEGQNNAVPVSSSNPGAVNPRKSLRG